MGTKAKWKRYMNSWDILSVGGPCNIVEDNVIILGFVYNANSKEPQAICQMGKKLVKISISELEID